VIWKFATRVPLRLFGRGVRIGGDELDRKTLSFEPILIWFALSHIENGGRLTI
jgi:hypothetical protein